MPSPGSLITFNPNTLEKSADVNTNFSTLRNSLLTAGFIDTANTWAISQAFAAGFTTSGTVTFTSGITVVSGTTITATGVTLLAGVAVSLGFTVSGTSNFNGIVNINATSGFTAPALFTSTVTMTTALTAVAGTTITSTAGAAYGVDGGQTTGLGGVAGSVQLYASNNQVLTGITGAVKMGSGVNLLPQAATLATSATVGFIFIPTVPSTSTGTPNPISGSTPAAMVYDTTNNHLLIWNPGSSSWKSATFA